jgi:hypothetical protein
MSSPAPAIFVPQWKRNPATVTPPAGVDDFIARANIYFNECADSDIRPTITGFALAVGLPGPTSLLRLGQRIPELRYVISRCMIAVASGYEELIGMGNATGPIFMLKNIPDFDPDEPIGAPAVQFFNDRKEILLQSNVHGAARSDSEFDDEDPIETYLRLLKQRGYVPSDEQETTVLRKPADKITGRRALTIITEGWEDD